jgi:hypothetical protein
MQNIFIRGETLKDYSILTCCSPREVCDMMSAAGMPTRAPGPNDGDVVGYPFTVPISFLNHSPASHRNSWPVDGSVLAGPIQVSVNWRNGAHAFVKTANAVPIGGLPTSFSKVELTCKISQLQDASFSVKKAMMLDPQLVYSLPARYITSVDYTRQMVPGAAEAINLASAPSGMLEGILISIRPAGADILAAANVQIANTWHQPNAALTSNVRGGSCTLDQIRLEFGGQNLFKSDSYEEYKHFIRSTFGDTMEWTGQYQTANIATTDVGLGTDTLIHPVYFIPLLNSGYDVMRGHLNENLPSYGGSQLQLYLTASAEQRCQKGPNINKALTIGPNSVGAADMETFVTTAAVRYQIWIGYIVSGLLEISQGTVDLQL